MQTVVTDETELARLVQPKTLAEQGFPMPKAVWVNRALDHSGDDSYYVYLIFSDNVSSRTLAWKNVGPMVYWVRERIWQASGEERIAYVQATRESDLRKNYPHAAAQF